MTGGFSQDPAELCLHQSACPRSLARGGDCFALEPCEYIWAGLFISASKCRGQLAAKRRHYPCSLHGAAVKGTDVKEQMEQSGAKDWLCEKTQSPEGCSQH